MEDDIPQDAAKCSFCGRGRGEVPMLIAGIEGYVCEECIGNLQGMLIERSRAAIPLRIIGVTLTRREQEHRILTAIFPAGVAAAVLYQAFVTPAYDQIVRWTGSIILMSVVFLIACFLIFALSELERRRRLLGRITLALAWFGAGFVVAAPFGITASLLGGILSALCSLVISVRLRPPPPKLWRPGPSRVQ